MKSYVPLIVLGTALMLSSCGEHIRGNGNVTQEEREIGDFTEVDVSGMFEIELVQGNPKVQIETDENLHEHIKTKMDGDVLIIHSDNKIFDTDHLVIRVYYKDLKELDLSGASRVTSSETIKGDDLEIEVSGASDIDFDVKLKSLELELSGGSEVRLTGKTKLFEIEVSGAADIDAYELKADDVSVDITGAGEVEVDARKTLHVDITGAGKVTYLGEPEITQSITGAGEIKRKED